MLLADIEDMRAVFGPEVRITIPTINPANLRRYVQEGPDLRIAPMPTVFFASLRRFVKESDLVFLVEGSTYMDTWTSALLWAYLWATHWADEFDKPCAAYAVDAGQIKSGLNRRLVRSQASETDLIITRAAAAAERLRGWGVTAPIEVTADNAFTFVPDACRCRPVRPAVAGGREPGHGLALVDFYLFPWSCAHGPQGGLLQMALLLLLAAAERRASEELADSYAALADHLVTEHGVSVALICMEELDERIARKVHARMACADKARIFSSASTTPPR